MSRRHNSSRRRNYGRRQHEIRERRPGALGPVDSNDRASLDDWRQDGWHILETDDDRPSKGAADGVGGNSL